MGMLAGHYRTGTRPPRPTKKTFREARGGRRIKATRRQLVSRPWHFLRDERKSRPTKVKPMGLKIYPYLVVYLKPRITWVFGYNTKQVYKYIRGKYLSSLTDNSSQVRE